NVGGTLFFSAWNGLWKSDGTAAGTVLVASYPYEGFDSYSLSGLTNVNGTLFFVVNFTYRYGDENVGYTYTGGSSLYRTDGTSAATGSVGEFYGIESIRDLAAFGGTLFINYEHDTSSGLLESLWKSDGTAGGTVFVRDFVGYSRDSLQLTAVGDRLFLTAST